MKERASGWPFAGGSSSFMGADIGPEHARQGFDLEVLLPVVPAKKKRDEAP